MCSQFFTSPEYEKQNSSVGDCERAGRAAVVFTAALVLRPRSAVQVHTQLVNDCTLHLCLPIRAIQLVQPSNTNLVPQR
jgi:hypothetical protein